MHYLDKSGQRAYETETESEERIWKYTNLTDNHLQKAQFTLRKFRHKLYFIPSAGSSVSCW